VTYTRPAPDHQPTPDPAYKFRIDTTFVHWSDNQGADGYIEQLTYHKQPYYPEWIESNTLTLTGARLPDNYQFVNNQYVLFPYEYGYADNHPNAAQAAQLNIEWAVRADGTPIHLSQIHFVKVYTALLQQLGMIGETSTEIMGARDLHPDALPTGFIETDTEKQTIKTIRDGQVVIIRNGQTYNPLGTIIK